MTSYPLILCCCNSAKRWQSHVLLRPCPHLPGWNIVSSPTTDSKKYYSQALIIRELCWYRTCPAHTKKSCPLFAIRCFLCCSLWHDITPPLHEYTSVNKILKVQNQLSDEGACDGAARVGYCAAGGEPGVDGGWQGMQGQRLQLKGSLTDSTHTRARQVRWQESAKTPVRTGQVWGGAVGWRSVHKVGCRNGATSLVQCLSWNGAIAGRGNLKQPPPAALPQPCSPPLGWSGSSLGQEQPHSSHHWDPACLQNLNRSDFGARVSNCILAEHVLSDLRTGRCTSCDQPYQWHYLFYNLCCSIALLGLLHT